MFGDRHSERCANRAVIRMKKNEWRNADASWYPGFGPCSYLGGLRPTQPRAERRCRPGGTAGATGRGRASRSRRTCRSTRVRGSRRRSRRAYDVQPGELRRGVRGRRDHGHGLVWRGQESDQLYQREGGNLPRRPRAGKQSAHWRMCQEFDALNHGAGACSACSKPVARIERIRRLRLSSTGYAKSGGRPAFRCSTRATAR